MPEISRFYGIVVAMYYADHEPPHFHCRYAGHEIRVRIADGAVDGHLPRRALTLVREWYTRHRSELEDNWRRARRREPLLRIEPLE